MSTPPRARAIAAFLHYGYVPAVPRGFRNEAWAGEIEALPQDEVTCLAAGQKALEEVFGAVGSGLQLVPLSGGIDSRVILGMLVEGGHRERVLAVTFGTPGTLDYELGRAVARSAGVRHEALDLTREPLDEASLEAVLPRAGPWTHSLEAHFNALVPRRFGAGAVTWSGIMANLVNGSRVGEADADWEQALVLQARERRAVRSCVLTPPSYDATELLPRAPLLERSRLSAREQLHFALDYPCRFDAVLLTPGVECRTPFRDPAWVRFALGLPTASRRDERFFRRLVARRLPELFRIPTKSRHGVALGAPAWRAFVARQHQRVERRLRRLVPRFSWRAAPDTNYLDYDLELRRDSPLSALVGRALAGLEARGVVPWIDLERLQDRHALARANHADALLLLTELERNLAAGIPPVREG